MSKKYDIRFCKCGRIHAIDNAVLDKALKNNKNLLLICGGCGAATLIGADVDAEGYMMYSADFSPYENTSIIPADFENSDTRKGIEEIFYSLGYKVPMMTEEYATMCFSGYFVDTTCPDFSEIQKTNITTEEIMNFIDEHNRNKIAVNMSRFIRETPDDVLEAVSSYLMRGFDWVGTKYEKSWHK